MAIAYWGDPGNGNQRATIQCKDGHCFLDAPAKHREHFDALLRGFENSILDERIGPTIAQFSAWAEGLGFVDQELNKPLRHFAATSEYLESLDEGKNIAEPVKQAEQPKPPKEPRPPKEPKPPK